VANNQPSKDQFPRSSEPPQQSPKYWVKEKDRYLRQLLIRDIEAVTKRPLIVFFSQLDQLINHTDPDDLSEILLGTMEKEADLLIQTPGGNVDATEKIISILRQRLSSYRVIVPSWAKSAGTIIAMSANKIVLGVNSELGPIDPQFQTTEGMIPGELLAGNDKLPYHVRELARLTVERNRILATDLLTKGMMKGRSQQEVSDLIAKVSSANGYKSHGAVIDHSESKAIGLDVEYLGPDDEVWRRIWLLYCMYDFDIKAKNLGKIFEGAAYSIARPK
jgi:membrane-bound ClpP family serine protease